MTTVAQQLRQASLQSPGQSAVGISTVDGSAYGWRRTAEGAPDYTVKARRSFHGVSLWDSHEIKGEFVFDKLELPPADTD
jgi:hypothetical protein